MGRTQGKTTGDRFAGLPGRDEVLPLVEAKLAVPRPRAEIVDRPRIRHALDAGEDAALTLVSAPAGYGKTTAVRAWCESRERILAWVTLDAGDNDPFRLWRYVSTAADRIRQGLGRGALQRLNVPGSPIESPIGELMNGLAAFDSRVVLVLDDFQAVTDPACLASIDYALEHRPASARLIIVTRADPQLQLAQLRARGDLVELRASELAFTAAEARELLVERGDLELRAEEVGSLVERTEGWAAALVLAGLWLRNLDDPSRAVREFGPNVRFLADYLSGEVLASLDDDLRSFLFGASVLGRFTAELCDAVLERSDSASVLTDLEHSNMFVNRLERGGWFRIHPLFAEYVVAELASLEADAAAQIHERAARWYISRGLPGEASEHAAEAGDHELLAQVLVEFHLSLIRSGLGATLLRRVRELPDERVVEHPELAVAAAAAAALSGHGTIEHRRLLQLADRARAERPEHVTPYVEAVALMVRAMTLDAGVAQAVLDGRRAVEVAQTDADEILTAALAGYARALYFAGELDEAWEAALRELEHPSGERRMPAHAHARATLALVAVERGQIASARDHADRAKAVIGRIGTSRSWLGANASVALGVTLEAEGKLADAEHELRYAEHYFRDEIATVHHAWLLILLARVRRRRGRLDESDAALGAARTELEEIGDSGRLPSLAGQVERELTAARKRVGSGEMLLRPSAAELRVLRMLATDLSTRQIGEHLFISADTVRSHRRTLYRKLGVNSRADAVARAITLGLLEQTKPALDRSRTRPRAR